MIEAFSEALAIMDRNTERYMVEQAQEELQKAQESNMQLQKEIELLKSQR